MRLFKSFIFLFLLFGVAVSANAQRLIPGQWEFAFGGGVSPIQATEIPINAELAFNKVNYHSKMLCKLSMITDRRDYRHTATSEEAFDYVDIDSRNYDIFASWGYLWNIVHSRSRGVNLWGGITVDMGARVRTCLDDANSSRLPSCGFLYGFSPELNFEFFVGKVVSMSLFARPHIQFYTRDKACSSDGTEPWFYPIFGLQFNFYTFVGK